MHGIAMGLRSFSTTHLEGVVAAAEEVGDVDYVLQLYVMKNRGTSEMFIRKAGSIAYIYYGIETCFGKIPNLRKVICQVYAVLGTDALQLNFCPCCNFPRFPAKPSSMEPCLPNRSRIQSHFPYRR